MANRLCGLGITVGLGLVLLTNSTFADIPLGPNGTVTRDPLAGTNYTDALPGWATGTGSTMEATMTADMTGDWGGTATSEVWRLTTGPNTGKLGFTYRFDVADTGQSLTGLVRASFDFRPQWGNAAFLDVGSDGSGSSTPVPGGVTTWSDGDPATIERVGGVPAFNFRINVFGDLYGTTVLGGQSSAVIFFLTDAETYMTTSVSLIDQGLDGDVDVFAVPTPAGVLLGVVGLATIGWMRRSMG